MIVNAVGSSIACEADSVFYTFAGTEISVATTKAYSAQLITGCCIVLQLGFSRNVFVESEYMCMLSELQTLPDKIEKILQDKERLQ